MEMSELIKVDRDNHFSSLLEHNDISLSHGAKKSDAGPQTEYHERCHALKDVLTELTTYLIDSRPSNHMVAAKQTFSTLTLSRGPSIHTGDDSQIPAARRGSVKIHDGEFKNVMFPVRFVLFSGYYVSSMTTKQ